MRPETIIDALTFLDEDVIQSAEAVRTAHKRSRSGWLRRSTAAACACLAAAAASLLFLPSGEKQYWPVTEIHLSGEGDTELGVIPHWDEMEISEQFASVDFDNKSFSTRTTQIEAGRVGVFLGDAVLSGYDIYTDTSYEAGASLYEIGKLSPHCAIALRFDGQSEYYVYVNSWYRPETLGQFSDDLDLKNQLSFGSAWYQWQKESGEYSTVEFTGLDEDMIWELLLSDRSLPAVGNYDSMHFVNILSISVNIPLLGYENISLGVTEDGYLTTNILDTGKAFFIGPEKVQRLKDYVFDNCEGHEIVYIYENEPVPE